MYRTSFTKKGRTFVASVLMFAMLSVFVPQGVSAQVESSAESIQVEQLQLIIIELLQQLLILLQQQRGMPVQDSTVESEDIVPTQQGGGEIVDVDPFVELKPSVRPVDTARKDRPNVVFIMLDDLDYGDIGAYGNTSIQTPYMDQLAEEGMKLTSYYANAAVCSPTRVGLLSGQYPSEFGILRQVIQTTEKGIPGNVTLLPELMKRQGYATGHFGKWHVGHNERQYLPTQNGYDEAVVDYYGVIDNYYNPTFTINDREQKTYRGQHATEVTTQHALDFIRENADKPFFTQVWYHAPHDPLDPPADWAARYPNDNKGKYAALVSDTDEDIGKIVNLVKELGIDDNTLVVVTSDNGGTFRDRSYNTPYRGGKGLLFEGGIRVPLIAWWPGKVDAGATNDSLVVGFDWYPTIAELAGIAPRRVTADGTSIRDVLLSDRNKTRTEAVIWETKKFDYDGYPAGFNTTFAVRKGKWKLIYEYNPTFGGSPESSARLYDIESDPGESRDRAQNQQRVVEDLLEEYKEWRRDTGNIDYRVASTQGGARMQGDTMMFDRPGTLILADDVRFKTSEANLSIVLDVGFDEGSSDNPILVEKQDSWQLSLTPNRKVVFRGHDVSRTGVRRTVELVSDYALQPDQDYRIAVSYDGFFGSEALVRLYINGELHNEGRTLRYLFQTNNAVTVGNNLQGTQPFLGEVSNLMFSLNALTSDEVEALGSPIYGEGDDTGDNDDDGATIASTASQCRLGAGFTCDDVTLARPGIGSEVEFRLNNQNNFPVTVSQVNFTYDGESNHQGCGKFSSRKGVTGAGYPTEYILDPGTAVYVTCNPAEGATIFFPQVGKSASVDFDFEYLLASRTQRVSGSLQSVVRE